jgi:hypothetical protein
VSRIGLAILVVASGCSSLIDNPCESGFTLSGGHCVVAGNGPDGGPGSGSDGPDGGGGSGSDGAPLTCTAPEIVCDNKCLDVSSDPDNCGGCHHVCASGICTAGHCEGDVSGHIVAIGHDYQRHHAAMARVIGNAVALASPHDVGVGWYQGSAAGAAKVGTRTAVQQAMTAINRPWHDAVMPEGAGPLTGVDVLVIEAQTAAGDVTEASAIPWADPIDQLLQRGGVVIVLEGASGSSYRFAQGAGLFTIAQPIDATGEPSIVTGGGDAIAQQVVSPYLAETTSVTFPGMTPAVVTTMTGGTVVFHATKY